MMGLVPSQYPIGKSHLIGLSMLLFNVMTCLSKAYDNFTWEIEKKALQYGEDLRLSCQVENCCIKSVGWVKWTSDDVFDTIFIDVKDLGDEEGSKYGGGTDETGFFLIIRNITTDDLNISYSCTYGFLFSKGKVLLEKDAFFGTAEIIPTVDTKLGLNLNISLPPVFVAVLIFIVMGIIIVYYRRKLRNNNNTAQGTCEDIRQPNAQSNGHQSTEPLLPTVDYILSQMGNSSNGDKLVPPDNEPLVGEGPRSNTSRGSLKINYLVYQINVHNTQHKGVTPSLSTC